MRWNGVTMDGRRRWRQEQAEQMAGNVSLRQALDLNEYFDELAEIRTESKENLATAGERALKTLDRFLATIARARGMLEERPSMSDSLRYLERGPGAVAAIARQADRYRDTRNALAHNPDITLRPEAAMRVIDGVEGIIRMAAGTAHEIARRKVVAIRTTERAIDARDRMLAHGYNQIVVVNGRGGVVDLLTQRDLVAADAGADLDGDGNDLTVGDVISQRGHSAVALLPRTAAIDDVIAALRDEATGGVVVTEHGRAGERPLGIVTRGDVLKLL
jgi:CBS domain-containing protein